MHAVAGATLTDMHLNRYQRQTVQEALRAMRADLGPATVVLLAWIVPAPHHRGSRAGRLVEVTAAADRPAMTEDRPATPATPTTCLRGTAAHETAVAAEVFTCA
jgi:hypothetical protein